MALDECIETAQRAEYLDIALVVGTQLYAKLLRHDERNLQHVDRIQSEAFAVKRRLGIYLRSRPLEVEGIDDQARELLIQKLTGKPR